MCGLQFVQKASELVEKVADLEHQQWAHWTRYMLYNLTPENIDRWREQIETKYPDWSEAEKDSDRKWAEIVIAVVMDAA